MTKKIHRTWVGGKDVKKDGLLLSLKKRIQIEIANRGFVPEVPTQKTRR